MSFVGGKPLLAWTKAHWRIIRRAGVACFIVVVLIMLAVAIARIEWGDVLTAIRKLPPSTFGMAALLTVASYLVYSTLDVLGQWYTEHRLAWWRSMMVGFISYAFTMTLGVGAGGMRLRLYTKQGLEKGVIMRVWGLSLGSNWIGYLLLAGLIFASGEVRLPDWWSLGNHTLRIMGVVMALIGAAYVLLCMFSPTRSWTLHGHELELPGGGLAIVQMTLAILNWALIAAVIYVLLQQKVPYLTVLGTLLISAIAGVIAHIPGGLGVIESVFIALLAPTLPQFQILGALLVYRAIYYLSPLLIAGIGYVLVEAKMKKSPVLPA